MKCLAILGSTGSIGCQAFSVIQSLNQPEPRFSVEALAAGENLDLLVAQINAVQPKLVAIKKSSDIARLEKILGREWRGEILVGEDGLQAIAQLPSADLVLNGLVGAAGLSPTLASLYAGKTVALANKESLVIGGHLIKRALSEGNGKLIPVDSEHSALFQLFEGRQFSEIARLVLTASGGPLRTRPLEDFSKVTVAEVLKHPTWQMGKRITVDSATLVNKAFEVIEAHWLFDLPFEKIHTLIHPQSLVHGLVELIDGAVLAHLSVTDMKLPIQYALTYPERMATELPRLDLIKHKLEFDPVGEKRYPAFRTVVEAGKVGGTLPAVVNATDEVLVQRFLNGEIPFTGIAQGIQEIAEQHEPMKNPTLEEILEADRWTRERASMQIG
ncbi:1-deoxy-D-xylulose-5-phosphate reductoisomerase [Candidatus Acetothermia bacterium]|nr:1-deoxy-D-xylulose-5-phosphate reductoisomerase [Candidatus Acetothermia bacterium]MBI3660836.1 1-deoxy-D-xylulose-5-phosphate reductoisomerase [Candidatus Acetothermia bacterium]